MDIPWGSDASRKFISNVGLILSDGPHGPNIMACEWTNHVSYKPGLMAISVHRRDATYDNILHTRTFSLSLASIEQNVVSSVAGKYTGKEIDKIATLKELGFRFSPAREIRGLVLEDAALNVECRLVQEVPLGDHSTLIGEALRVTVGDKEPLVYYGGKYWRIGEQIVKPPQEELDRISRIVLSHRKQPGERSVAV